MMKKTAAIRKGFTLLELIIVMVIMIVIGVMMTAGVLALQNITRLDSAVRSIKIEIQSTQNQSRNSFITYNRRTSSGREEDLFRPNGQSFLNVGWIITFTNTTSGTSSTLNVRRQAVFFKPEQIYSMDSLRADISNIHKNKLAAVPFVPFGCNSSSRLVQRGIQVDFLSANTLDTKRYELRCADATYSESDYFNSVYPDVVISDDAADLGTNGLNSCWQNSASNQQSIFFTSGYGESIARFTASGPEDCQLVFRTVGLSTANKALRVSKDNGSIELCANYCSR